MFLQHVFSKELLSQNMLYTLKHGAGFHDSVIHGQPLVMVLMQLVSHQTQAFSWLLASILRTGIHS